MAMEMHVFVRGALPKKAALNRALKELEFPLSITPTTGSLEQQSGFLPMRLWREEAGVELSIFDGRETVEELAGPGIDPGFERTASFRWSSDESEMLAAMCAAAALAKLTNGIVLEEEDGRLLQPDEAVALARQHLKATKPRGREPGTRPADIKRYLGSLLKMRSDLVLVGRHLLVRPVRHVLRGAVLSPLSDKYEFRLWRYLQLLGDSKDGSYSDVLHEGQWKVWQPHFEALLFETLGEEVFAHLGSMTTLADFAAHPPNEDHFPTGRVHALVLFGRRDDAADFIREMQHHNPGDPYWEHWATEQWAFLARDINDVCAEFHAAEAETIKAMKLEHIWEPSPFPVELPVGQQHACIEPFFPTAPWISRSPRLLQDVPQCQGDIRYAKDCLFRDGETILVVPLTRDEAEERHREYEPYVLAARTKNGLLALLRRDGTDRHDPWRIKHPGRYSRASIIFEVYGADYAAQALLFQDDQLEGLLHLSFVDVLKRRERTSFWSSGINPEDGLVRIHDNREPGDTIFTKRPLSEVERAITAFPIPAFGEFEELSARTHAWLQSAGYGDLT